MNLTEYSMNNRTISWMILSVLLVGGALAFWDLGRLEDPPFVVKDAMIVTAYPGATAEEVELELTHPLENAVRQLAEVSAIRSVSMPGMSQIKVEMDNERDLDRIDQLWDKLRRKIEDVEPLLPIGAQVPRLFDDYGDVYGITLMVTGDNYDYSELKQYIDGLQRELQLIEGVGKVTLFGDQQEQIFVEVSLEKLNALELDFHRVVGFLNEQNSVLDTGRVTINGETLYMRLGGLSEDIDPVIHGRDSGRLVRLSDVASILRGYSEIPSQLIRMNGEPAVALGISFAKGVNVVEVGDRIAHRLTQLEPFRPAGITVQSLYNQPEEVKHSINGFLISLAMSVSIVIVSLLVTMGWRSGLIVGASLLLAVFGTFILMKLNGFQLHRLSLGALIIALGMLVDNAIVVVEGVLVGMAQGCGKKPACLAILRQTRWPLLVSTLIAILAFTPFGLSDSDAGQMMKAMFWVLTYSLLLSWVIAMVLTPFLVDVLLPEIDRGEFRVIDPYQGVFYSFYRRVLDWSLGHKRAVIAMMLFLLALSMFGMGHVKKAFFPTSNTPIFYIDIWLPQGTDIRSTLDQVAEIEDLVHAQDEVEFVAASIGRGAPRFTATYLPEQSHENFAQLQVRAVSREALEPLMRRLDTEIYRRFPAVLHQLRDMEFGPPARSKIEARFSGPEPGVLRRLGEQAEAVLRADPEARSVYSDWKERGKELVPLINESEARRLGISNSEISLVLKTAFGGLPVGMYRDGTRNLPIVMRLPEAERVDFERIDHLRIWSPTLQTYVPIQQLVRRVEMRWSDTLIRRENRQRTLTVLATNDLFSGNTADLLFQRIRPQVEAISLPPGYRLEWGGEYENQQRSLKGAFGGLPLALLVMFMLTVGLFNSIRKSLVIWLTVPLSVIGVASGLLMMDMPLTFPALLGMLALTGMVLKNGIVLIDQVQVELDAGKDRYSAVRDSAISRMRPVGMAAATTVLGMLPLLADPFFASQAITFIFGLSFATVLTLIVVPVLFLSFYGPDTPGRR